MGDVPVSRPEVGSNPHRKIFVFFGASYVGPFVMMMIKRQIFEEDFPEGRGNYSSLKTPSKCRFINPAPNSTFAKASLLMVRNSKLL